MNISPFDELHASLNPGTLQQTSRFDERLRLSQYCSRASDVSCSENCHKYYEDLEVVRGLLLQKAM